MSIISQYHRPATAVRLRGIVRDLFAPPVRRPSAVSAPAPQPSVSQPSAPDPAGLFTAAELPSLADIESAAEKFLQASEQNRAADRTKRAARKILDRLPAGRYGMWNVQRVDSAREVADLDAIRAVFQAHGLGDVPMKPCAASLKVEFAPVPAEFAQVSAGTEAGR